MPISSERLQDRARDTAPAQPGVSHGRPFTEQLDVYEVAGKAFLLVTDDQDERTITRTAEPKHGLLSGCAAAPPAVEAGGLGGEGFDGSPDASLAVDARVRGANSPSATASIGDASPDAARTARQRLLTRGEHISLVGEMPVGVLLVRPARSVITATAVSSHPCSEND